MTWAMNADTASRLAAGLWFLLLFVWLALAFSMKKAKKQETQWERLQHTLAIIFGFWLLFENNWKWLNLKLWPVTQSLLWIGLGLTAAGVAISIWARVTLGANWSSVVTLKEDHELIRKGPYRWVRHPIYTGILVSFIGTELIKGHLRGWMGLAIVLATFYFKARREERFLQQEFGAGFEEHARRTGMFLPKWT